MPEEPTTTALPPIYSAENINPQDAQSGMLGRATEVLSRNPAACLATALVTGAIIGWLVKRK